MKVKITFKSEPISSISGLSLDLDWNGRFIEKDGQPYISCTFGDSPFPDIRVETIDRIELI